MSISLRIPSVCYAQINENVNGLLNAEVFISGNETAKKDIIDELDIRNESISNVLRVLSNKSGYSIVVEPDVKGMVTIYLQNIDVRDALRIVVDMNDLAYVEKDGFFSVMTKNEFETRFGYSFGQQLKSKVIALVNAQGEDMVAVLNQVKSKDGKIIYSQQTRTLALIDSPEKIESMSSLIEELDSPIKTQTFKLQFAKIDEVAKDIERVLTKDKGKVTFNAEVNTVTVVDTVLKLKQISKLVQRIDHQNKEVLIEAKIMQITLNDEHIDGIDWEAIVSDYQAISIADPKPDGKKDVISLGVVSDEDYEVLVDALDTVGVINTISNISRVTSGLEPVEIIAKSLEYELKAEQDRIEVDEDFRFFTIPNVAEDGLFIVRLKPEQISDVSSKELAEMLVEVREGSTIVIGGMFKNVAFEKTRKIPLLGDLPLLGFAFRNQRQSYHKTEIIIFITPRMVAKDTIL